MKSVNLTDVVPPEVRSAALWTFANESIGHLLTDDDREQIKREIAAAFEIVFASMRIDTDNDHNTKETATRIARMYVDEVFRGRFHPMPRMTEFPNAKRLDELYTVGPVTVRSACSHHFVPIIGKAWLGVIPSERLIGLSKFTRLTEWVMARPQIQEEAAVQLADAIEDCIQPHGLAVVIKAQHLCMTWRGVRDNGTEMVTSVMRGAFRDNPMAREEFMAIIKGQGYA